MKQALVRFLVYLALLSIVFAVFGVPIPSSISSQLNSRPEQGISSIVGSALALVAYLGCYAVAIGFWLLVFELTYRVCRRLRKPVDMP
jgi:hypothetical protein